MTCTLISFPVTGARRTISERASGERFALVRWPRAIGACWTLVMLTSPSALGQTSSIGAQQRLEREGVPSEKLPREASAPQTNATYSVHSWVSFGSTPPRAYRVNDLLTVIVRQQRSFEIEADLKTEKKWDVKSQLDAFFKPIAGGLGSADFRRGKPNIGYSWKNKLDAKGDTSREDKLTTRITTRIIDVKPNGLIVLEGRGKIQHDDEVSTITITGTCRKEDVTADNSVLSTQIADLAISIDNKGALRAASSRGWVPRFIDWMKPI